MRAILLLNLVGLTILGIVALIFSQSGAQQVIAQDSLNLLLRRQGELEHQVSKLIIQTSHSLSGESELQQKVAVLINHTNHQHVQLQEQISRLIIQSSSSSPGHLLESAGCPPVLFVRPFRKRADLGAELRRLGLKGIGIEVGVQLGFFSEEVLRGWQQAHTFVQVDLWAPQENYKDAANKDQEQQDGIMNHALTLLKNAKEKGWVNNTRVCRNFSTVCVHQFEDNSLDFVYIDARHDRKGVLEDLAAYWPKVKKGGVIAGHDYLEMSDLPGFPDDWTVNSDGTRDLTGRVVKGAVDDFFSGEAPSSPIELRRCPRQVTVGYNEGSYFTWAVGK